MIIALDLDGIVCDPIKSIVDLSSVQSCTANPDAIRCLQEIKRLGHSIMILSKRDPSLCLDTELWMQRNKIPYDYIIFGRPRYDILIDLNNHKFENWDSFMKLYKNKLESN